MMKLNTLLILIFSLELTVGLSSCGNTNEMERLKTENDSLRSVINKWEKEAEIQANLAQAQADSAKILRMKAEEKYRNAMEEENETKIEEQEN